MSLEEMPGFNADLASSNQTFGVVWSDVNPEDPHADAESKEAVRFNRLEGAYFAGGALWFDDTAGGEKRLGQIYRYLPATETLELFHESTNSNMVKSPDNITVAPWGDLWFVEDGKGPDRVVGITPAGQVYAFARNRLNYSELAGPTFAPDGRTFFVNVQNPGITFAIWGPFTGSSSTAQYQMAHSAPPESLAPVISEELAELARRHGMTRLEAAAYERLGVPLA